jgi:O-antigen/teichoic acid export membrane protein
VRRKFIHDWAANLASIAMLALSGLLVNGLITKLYGPAALGVFNQVYAVFIIGAQLATFGIQFSALHYISSVGRHHAEAPRILAAAILSVAGAATVIVLCIFVIFRLIGASVFSPGVAQGILLIMPGMWCFAINKVLLNALNAVQANVLYGLLTGVRYLLVLLCLIGAIMIGVEGDRLCLILTAGEAILLLILAIVSLLVFPRLRWLPGRKWISAHYAFGSRSLLGGLAVELNSRIDILILGLFTNDVVVGVYSFAAFFIEGLLQLTVISRRLIDPILTRLAVDDAAALLTLLHHWRKLGIVVVFLVGSAAVITYPVYATIVGTWDLAMASWPVFAILAAGAGVFAVYASFGGIFSQTGRPALQSKFNLVFLGANVALNFALVPFYGLIGAAVATSVSFLVGTVYFRALVRRHLALEL